MDGFWRWGLLAIVWGLALVGIGVKIFFMKSPRWLSAGLYILLGWLCLAGVSEMLRVIPPGGLAWLVAGGIIFTLGALVYVTKKFDFFPGVFGFHEVWHIFVLSDDEKNRPRPVFFIIKYHKWNFCTSGEKIPFIYLGCGPPASR